jgi:hypothetical protein
MYVRALFFFLYDVRGWEGRRSERKDPVVPL